MYHPTRSYNRVLVSFLVIAFMFISSLAASGESITEVWSKNIGGSKHWVSISNSGTIALVKTTNTGSELMVFSSSGDLMKSWGPPSGSSFSIAKAREGCIIVTFGDTFSSLSPDGEEQQWGLSLDDLYGVGITPECNKVVVTSAPTGEPSTVSAASGNGSTLWSTKVESWVWDPAVSKNGYIALGGQKYGMDFDKGRNAVYLMNSDGRMLWSKGTSSAVFNISISRDGKRILAALDEGGMVLLDNQGNILWRKVEIGGVSDISSDGNYVAAGKEGHVVMLDSNGKIVWENSEVPAMGEILVSPHGGLTIVKGPMNNEGYILGNHGEIIKQVSLSGFNPGISISSNGKYLVFAGKEIRVFRGG